MSFPRSSQDDVDVVSLPDETMADDESLYEETPVDGYFGDRAHPQQRFVENSAVAAEAATKAAEAAYTRAGGSREMPPSPSSQATVEATRVFDVGAPPPDYASATASWSSPRPSSRTPVSSSSPSQSSSRLYNPEYRYGTVIRSPVLPDNRASIGARTSFEDMQQAPEDHRSPAHAPVVNYSPEVPTLQMPSMRAEAARSDLVPSLQQGHIGLSGRSVFPQSMRDRPTLNEETPLLVHKRHQRRRRYKAFSSWTRSCFRPMALINMLLVLVVVLLVALLAMDELELRAPGTDSRQPSDGGNNSDIGGGAPNKSNPTLPIDLPNATLPHPPTRMCKFDVFSDTWDFEFPQIDSFSFIELLEDSESINGGISGTVRVIPGESEQKADVQVKVSYATMAPYRVVGIGFVKSKDKLLLQMPRMQRDFRISGTGHPCLDVYVEILVRPGLSLTSFDIEAGNLNIRLEEGLFNATSTADDVPFLRVADTASFTAVIGSVFAAYWTSREVHISTVSSDIAGRFALRDVVDIFSQSGSIETFIEPKEADSSRPRPAQFRAVSTSGAVDVRFMTNNTLPARDYESRAESVSGPVTGNFVLGSVLALQTTSGKIDASIVPVYNSSQDSHLTADSKSGSIRLYVLRHYNDLKRPWINAVHKLASSAGSVSIQYEAWVGTFVGETLSGALRLHGNGWRIITDETRNPMYRYICAMRGTDGGKTSISTRSGSIAITPGDA